MIQILSSAGNPAKIAGLPAIFCLTAIQKPEYGSCYRSASVRKKKFSCRFADCCVQNQCNLRMIIRFNFGRPIENK